MNKLTRFERIYMARENQLLGAILALGLNHLHYLFPLVYVGVLFILWTISFSREFKLGETKA